MENFIDQLKKYKEEPRPQLWNRLEDKIELNNSKSLSKRYKLMMVSAMLLCSVFVWIYVLDRPHSASNDVFVSSGNEKSNIIGELDLQNTSNELFDRKKILQLEIAYRKNIQIKLF